MAVNFIEVLDVDGNWQSINLKQIARIVWGEIPDDERVDMIYLTDNSEIALPWLSDSSKNIAEAVGIECLETLLGVETLGVEDSEDDDN